MWKKADTPEQPSVGYVPTPVTPSAVSERAVIGSSIQVKGDLTGEEDVLVQGRVEGQIRLNGNHLTVGRQGRVKADIYAKSISVEGEVQGNLFGEEKITVRKSGNVKGNMIAPRVSLEDGATFKGSIDMGVKPAATPAATKSASNQTPKPTMSTSASSAVSASPAKTADIPLGRGR